MSERSAHDKIELATKWFDVVSRRVKGSTEPYYLINCTDFVVIVALDCKGRLLLVRQFRPAVNGESLELPSGHVDPGETPEQTARKELLEETGYEAENFELLTTISPAIGRFTNQMWCYFASRAMPTSDPSFRVEEGLSMQFYEGSLRKLVEMPKFCSSICHTALLAAVVRGKLPA